MDISNTFQDFVNKNDDNPHAPSLGIVIKNIFVSCDSENTGIVPISKVIDFIAPFLQGNAEALTELKTCLMKHTEQNDENATIDCETFYRNMEVWTEKMSTTDKTDDDICNMQELEMNGQNFPIARDLFKSYRESSESIILSAPESASNDSHEQCMAERCVLENHILELQHQKTQMNEELARMRSELGSCQDHNESLQGNLDKLVKKLANEQKMNENMQIEKKKGDEIQEELSCANIKITKLEKTVSSLEKVNNQLQQNYDVLQRQKQNLEQKIKNTDRKSEAVSINIRLLESEIESLKQDLASEQDTNVALLKQNDELQDVIEQCNINIDKIRLEKEALDKLLRNQMDRNESPIDLNRTHNMLNMSLRSNLESDDCEVLSLDKRTSESSDVMYYNLHMMMNSSECLQDEMQKAAHHEECNNKCGEDIEYDCQTRVNKMEVEKKLVYLQCELLQHESCTDIISKQKEEIKDVSRENINYKEQMKSMQEMLSDLKTQVSLGQEKERLLFEKCSLLEEDLKSNNSYVVEIQTKLSEYTDLENKCKILNQKIVELETDNSMKYIKIINLTVEIEKLRQIQAKADQQNKAELAKRISQLEEERRQHEQETAELFDKIKVLNEEKEALQREKETLLTKLIELENHRRELQNERDELQVLKQNLEVENCEFKSKRVMEGLQIDKFQSEKEALQMEKNLLKSENINLEISKDELESKLKARLEKLEKKVRCIEMENHTLLANIALIKQERDAFEADVIRYKNDECINSKLHEEYIEVSEALKKLQTEYDRIKSIYETLKNEGRDKEEKYINLINDNAKMAEDISKLINENGELSSKTSSLEGELNKLRKEISHYSKFNKNLHVKNQQLNGDNGDLLLKLEKNEAALQKMDIENKQLSVDLVNLKLTFDKVKGTMEKFEKFNETLIAENRTLRNSAKEKDHLSQQKLLEVKELEVRCGTYENEMNIVRNELVQWQKARIDLEESLKSKEALLLEMQHKLEKNIENNMLEMKTMEDLISEKQLKLEDTMKDLCCQKRIERQLKSDLDEVSKKIKQEIEKYDNLSKENSQLANELSEAKALCDKIKATNEELERQDVKSKGTISACKNRIAILQRENEILNKEKDNLKKAFEESDRKLADSLKTNAEFLQRNKQISEENAELSLKCNKLSEDSIKMKEKLAKANADVQEMWKELKITKRTVSENEQERLGLYKKKIDRYQEENAKIKDEIKNLRREKEMILEKSQYLERENMETKQQLENLLIEKDTWLTEKVNIYKNDAGGRTTTKTTTLDRLALKTIKLDDRIASLEDQLTSEKHKNTAKLKEIIELRNENGLLLAETTNVKEEINATKEANEMLKSEMEELIAKVDNLIEENEKLSKINEELENIQWKFSDINVGTSNQVVEVLENIEENSTGTNLDENEVVYELTNLRAQFESEFTKRDSILAYMNDVRDRLCKKRLRLGRATIHAMNVWKNNLDDNVIADDSEEGLRTDYLIRPLAGPLDEEILQVEHQINLTTSLLDKLTSMKNHILLESNQSMRNSDFSGTIEQETSPNFDRNVLENLGLSGDYVRVNDLSELEMEEKFTALVLAFTIDRTSLRQRCNRQKNRLRDRERALWEVVSNLTVDLEKYVKGVSEIDVSSRLEHVLSISAQISISAEQYGSLTQQSNLSQAIELMMNYVASLRRNIKTLPNQCLSTEPLPKIIYPNNELQLVEKDPDDVIDSSELNLHVPKPLREKKSWNKEIRFIITLSMAVLLAVIYLSTFENFQESFRVSHRTPPT